MKLANMNIKSSYMIKMIAFIKLLYNKKNHSINSYTRKLNIYFTKLFNKTEVVLINKKITPEVNVIKNYWLTSFVREKKHRQHRDISRFINCERALKTATESTIGCQFFYC